MIVLSQLNRELDKDKKRKPRLSDLRESGAIEQDADLVAMLFRLQTEDEDGGDTERTLVTLCIAKQRNGPTGEVALIFNQRSTRFESAPVEQEAF